MIRYIVDEDGNKTHAVIPMEIWEKFEDKLDSENTTKISIYPDKHINIIIDFLNSINNLPQNDWMAAYEDFYSYYKKMDIRDIMALHLFRTGMLGRMYIKEDKVVYEEVFKEREVTFLLNKNGAPLTKDSLDVLQKSIGISSEQQFLDIFNRTAKFHDDLVADYQTDYKRLRRNAERDRLFIYDLSVLYALGLCTVDESKNKLFISISTIFVKEPVKEGNLKNNVYKYIAKHLYGDNMSQVYRAAKEVEERINSMVV